MSRIIKMRLTLSLLLFLVISSVVSTQERKRGIYIDLGLGFGGVSYFGGDTKKIADDFKSTADIHMTIDLSLFTIGWALTQNVYLVGTLAGVGDRYLDSQKNQSQISIAMYGIGTRYYPLPSKKHLQLGLDVGASYMGVLYNKKTSNSDFGFSARTSIGWDFDSTMTGFAAILGGDLMLNAIEGDTSLSYALFFKLLFK
ncbi:MAG: hypothetical protein LBB80_02210 [Treponema sp.]|jgi:hypothetical protein|nr:hypothetical protein [Treponema sp.]